MKLQLAMVGVAANPDCNVCMMAWGDAETIPRQDGGAQRVMVDDFLNMPCLCQFECPWCYPWALLYDEVAEEWWAMSVEEMVKHGAEPNVARQAQQWAELNSRPWPPRLKALEPIGRKVQVQQTWC